MKLSSIQPFFSIAVALLFAVLGYFIHSLQGRECERLVLPSNRIILNLDKDIFPGTMNSLSPGQKVYFVQRNLYSGKLFCRYRHVPMTLLANAESYAIGMALRSTLASLFPFLQKTRRKWTDLVTEEFSQSLPICSLSPRVAYEAMD